MNVAGMKEVVVIGGGPAGSSAAWTLAKEGHDVLLLESSRNPGHPIRCGEAVSERTMVISELGTDGPWIKNRMEGWRIRSNSGDEMRSSVKGFCIRRDIFDRELLTRAEESGASIEIGTGVVSITRDSPSWKVGSRRGTVKCRKLVLACGPNRTLIEQSGGDPNMTFMKALEVKLDLRDPSEELLFLVSSHLKGGYGWYFPRGDEVNVGAVTFGDPSRELQWVMERLDLDPRKAKSHHGGIIPVSGMSTVRVDEDAVIVGDAGGFTNPVSKGGIIGAIFSGKEGGRAISDSLSGDDCALEKWEERMRDHPAFSAVNLERNRFLSSLSDEALDSMTSIVKGRDIWTLRKTELVKEVLRRKELRQSLKGALKLAIGGREWATWAF